MMREAVKKLHAVGLGFDPLCGWFLCIFWFWGLEASMDLGTNGPFTSFGAKPQSPQKTTPLLGALA